MILVILVVRLGLVELKLEMNITDFGVRKSKDRVCQLKLRLSLAKRLYPLFHQLLLVRHLQEEEKEMHIRSVRTMHIVANTFNFNVISDAQCLTDLCFRKCELLLILNSIGWSGESTERNSTIYTRSKLSVYFYDAWKTHADEHISKLCFV